MPLDGSEDIQKKFFEELSLLEQQVDFIVNDETKKDFLKTIEYIRSLWK